MVEEEISQEFRLRKIDKTRSYVLEEIKHNRLLGKKHKKVFKVLNYIKHLLILVSAITKSVLTSAFASLIGIPISITSPVLRNQSNISCINQ